MVLKNLKSDDSQMKDQETKAIENLKNFFPRKK